MLFLPYSTDAPVYYWPYATVGLIVTNVVLFFAVLAGNAGGFDSWMLTYGDGLHPDQWFRSMFMHGDIEHLIGNMLFLWVFGLVVEGKLGWWKFMCCYIAIGATQSMLEQILMSGYQGDVPGSVGASAAIFGLMAMATIWAPLNEITFFYALFLFVGVGTVDVGIAVLAGIYTGLDLISILLAGGGPGSGWLHLGGFLLGLPLAIVLLKRKLVDCEGWDAFHVWSGDYGAFKKEPAPAEVFAKVDAIRQNRDAEMLTNAQQQLRLFLKQGNAEAALRLYEKMKTVGKGLTLDREELLPIIQSLHTAKRWADSAPYMAEYIERFPAGCDAVRIKLAQICVVELQRPGKALELLAKVDQAKLQPPQKELLKRIVGKARQLQAEGTVELDVDTW